MKFLFLEAKVRKKVLILSIALLTFISILSSCKRVQRDPNDITNFLKDLKNYSTDFTMDIKNDKQVVVHEGKQYYKKGQGYRVELNKDRVFLYKSDKIYVNDVKNNFKYTLDKDFDNIYRITFVEQYINMLSTNEGVKYDYKTIEGKNYQLIELIIPGGTRETDKAVMYVNTKTYLPEWIIVYDENNRERIKITYKNFQCEEIDSKLFNID
ncbi:hypothetical protein HMPREF1982_00972 [Clostridiales bacterium oral taxon 876 str. F0540]|nr:hypothetical protein HMPREF1982_00972 [Clostridiales bacterium oral taxon 876 str. F0540]